jgi:hypothetical protein
LAFLAIVGVFGRSLFVPGQKSCGQIYRSAPERFAAKRPGRLARKSPGRSGWQTALAHLLANHSDSFAGKIHLANPGGAPK